MAHLTKFGRFLNVGRTFYTQGKYAATKYRVINNVSRRTTGISSKDRLELQTTYNFYCFISLK